MLHWFPFCGYFVIALVLTINAFSRYQQFSKRLTIFAFLCYFVIILVFIVFIIEFPLQIGVRKQP